MIDSSRYAHGKGEHDHLWGARGFRRAKVRAVMSLTRDAIARVRLEHLLAQTLGYERSTEVVAEAAQSLGFDDLQRFDPQEATALLEHLGQKHDLTGIAARFALNRLEITVQARVPEDDRRTSSSREPTKLGNDGSSAMLEQMVSLLAPSLGEERSRDAIAAAAEQLGVKVPQCTRENALAILESLSTDAGLIGIVARLAKAQLRLANPGRRP